MNPKKLIILSLVGIFLLMQGSSYAQSRRYRTPAGYDDGIAQKWEGRLSVGAEVGTMGDKAGLIDLGVGYNLNSNWYVGLVSGIYPAFGAFDGVSTEAYIPIMGDLTYRVNSFSESWSYFGQLRGGYLLPSAVDAVVTNPNPGEDPRYKRPGFASAELGLGVISRPLRNIDIRFSIHYALCVPDGDGHTPSRDHVQNMFQARVGMSFRGAPTTGSRSEMRAEAVRLAREQSEREYAQRMEQQRQREEESRRRAEAEREARRRERETGSVEVPAVTVDESVPTEFYCHVTPSMLEGNTYDNKLVQLASMAAGRQITSIIILGYASSNGADAIQQANTVSNCLTRRYVIGKDLVTTVFYGFENSSSPQTRPENAVGTIMIQKAK